MIINRIEGNVYAGFSGFRDVVVVEPVGFISSLQARDSSLHVEAFDAMFVGGVRHLQLLVAQSFHASRCSAMYANSFELDLILRVACEVQISRALSEVGLRKGKMDIAVVAVGGRRRVEAFFNSLTHLGEATDDVLNLTPKKEAFLISHHGVKREAFDSTFVKDDALSFLLAEKAALLKSEAL